MFAINRLRYMSFNFACSARTVKNTQKKRKPLFILACLFLNYPHTKNVQQFSAFVDHYFVLLY